MRHLVLCATSVLLIPLAVSATESGNRPNVKILMRFEGETSDRTMTALRTEVTKLLKPAGMEIEYSVGELGPGDTPTEIIVVKFKGRCRLTMSSPILDERGPFAFTHVSNGEILPFAEVSCDRVGQSINSLTGTVHSARGDHVFGRALGRVLAHEIYHILAKTPHHGESGVARRTMSASDLVATDLLFEGDDIQKLHARALSAH